MALVCASLGWGLFFVAVVFSSLYSDSRKMQGYEWIPGVFLVPLAWLGFCRWPHTSVGQGTVFSSAEERSANDTAINLRIGYIITMVMTALIMGGIFIVVGWFIPPETVKHVEQEVRGLHTSPSPTPTPKNPDPADPVTGTFLAGHMALLVMAIALQWLAVTTPAPTEVDDLPIDNL